MRALPQAVEAELAAVRAVTAAALQRANSGKIAYLQLLDRQASFQSATLLGEVVDGC